MAALTVVALVTGMQVAATGAAQASATCPLCHIILVEASSETTQDRGAAVARATGVPRSAAARLALFNEGWAFC